MPRTIALVACVSRKQIKPTAARHLYTSAWFRKASAYAQRMVDEWYILSAKYGLVAPDRVIAPYDETLNRMPARERRAWARRVLGELDRILSPGDHVVVLAGQRSRHEEFWLRESPARRAALLHNHG
jgi:hypothetical protein